MKQNIYKIWTEWDAENEAVQRDRKMLSFLNGIHRSEYQTQKDSLYDKGTYTI